MVAAVPVTSALVTPGTVRAEATQEPSAARPAVESAGAGRVTTASIGLAALREKSRSTVSATTRLSVPAGSTRASTPPNATRRNGSPSTSRSATMLTA